MNLLVEALRVSLIFSCTTHVNPGFCFERRDMQSYVSRLFLLVANGSSKLVFIVDNGPWTSPEYRFRPAELWQLMVTQVTFFPSRHQLHAISPNFDEL